MTPSPPLRRPHPTGQPVRSDLTNLPVSPPVKSTADPCPPALATLPAAYRPLPCTARLPTSVTATPPSRPGDLKEFIHHPLLYLHIHDADDHGQGEEIGRCEVNIDFLAKEHHHHFKEKVLHGGQECGKIEFDVAWEDTTQLVEGPLDA